MKHIERIIITDYNDENNIIFDSGTVKYDPNNPNKLRRSKNDVPNTTREQLLNVYAVPFKRTTNFSVASKAIYKVFQFDENGNKEPCLLFSVWSDFWLPFDIIVGDSEKNFGSFQFSPNVSDGKNIAGEAVIIEIGNETVENHDVWFLPLIPAEDSTFQALMIAKVDGEYTE